MHTSGLRACRYSGPEVSIFRSLELLEGKTVSRAPEAIGWSPLAVSCFGHFLQSRIGTGTVYL
ncbi:mCG147599 [Mus musculus]|nr:mCG147599 [Mus musculus]